jgi:hypothetical protein
VIVSSGVSSWQLLTMLLGSVVFPPVDLNFVGLKRGMTTIVPANFFKHGNP